MVGVVAVVGSNWFDGCWLQLALLMVCVCVCGSMCVVMGLDWLIDENQVCKKVTVGKK